MKLHLARHVDPSWHIRPYTIIYPGASIGVRLTTGDGAQIQRCIIGDDVVIGSNSVIETGAIIGNRVTVHTGVFVCDKTVIMDDVWIGPNVTILNTKFPHTSTSASERIGVEVSGIAALATAIRESIVGNLKNQGFKITDVESIDDTILRTLIREYGTLSYGVRLNHNIDGVLYHGHSYFGSKPHMSSPDSFPHINLNIGECDYLSQLEFILRQL
jgi:acetyltransferase-like isoleucine patch superfamily enzyme